MQERLKLLEALTKRAEVKVKSERLAVLGVLIPDAQDAWDRGRANVIIQERLLEEREILLLAQVEGKNEDARKTALLVAKQGDRDWHQLQNIVNTCRGNQFDAVLAMERLKREWVALTIQIHIFIATLEFLAGANSEREGTNHVG